MIALVLAWACGAEEPAGPTREQAEQAAEALARTAPPPAPPPAASGAAVKVELTFQGVGHLHMGFFRDAQAVAGLGQALAGRLKDNAQVYVRYDQDEQYGLIHLKVPPGVMTTPPTVDGERVDLAALAPLTTALSSYRSELASRFDVRIQNFDVGLDFFQGSTHCLVVPGGPMPPDGSIVSPCVRIGDAEVCGTPEPGGVRFAPDVAKKLRDCLR